MTSVTRRHFIAVSSAGAAGAVALGGVGAGVVSANSGGGDGPVDMPTGPVIVYIRDAASGQLELLIGDRAIKFTDKRLVNRVLREG
jgi:hypothetical protein